MNHYHVLQKVKGERFSYENTQDDFLYIWHQARVNGSFKNVHLISLCLEDDIHSKMCLVREIKT